MLLFSDVKYYISPSLPHKLQSQLHLVLLDNGAVQVPLESATHVVANLSQFEGWETVSDTVAVVTDKWVTRSILAGKILQPQFYSANPSMIFSGVIACATGLPVSDVEVLSAGIAALGGQWRTTLTRDVTHLFATSPGSEKYETALLFQEMTQVKVVVPQWFDDAVRLGTASLSSAEYEWPEPRVLREMLHPNADQGRNQQLAGDEKSLLKTAVWTLGQDVPVVQAGQRDIWQLRRILLSPSLGLTAGRRQAVEAGIERANGVIVKYSTGEGDGTEEEAAEKIQEADVFVTRYRSGVAYVKAVKTNKTIGTLAWLFHVESTGTVTRPLDQLLHYPIPKKAIEGFAAHEITVTNYTGEAREYLKKLITAMGAQFTPSMSGRNTVLVAAHLSGNKATKARSWSIPIVNHTWLEDCFVQWRNLTVGLEKYIVFPPGVDFSQMLSERGVGRVVLDEEDLYREVNDDEIGDGNHEEKPPPGTDTSARDENEVEEVIGLFGGDNDVITDSHSNSPSRRNAQREHRPSPSKSPNKNPHLFDVDGIMGVGGSAKGRGTRSPMKPVTTPVNGSSGTVAGTSLSHKRIRKGSIDDDHSQRSSPIDSPTTRKATRRLIDEDSDQSLGPMIRKRKVPTMVEDGGSSDSEVHRRATVVRKMRARHIKTITLDSDEDSSRSRASGTRTIPDLKVASNSSPQRMIKATVVPTRSVASPVQPKIQPKISPRSVPSVVIKTSRIAVPSRAQSNLAVAAETPSTSRKRECPTSHKASPPMASTSDTSFTLLRATTKRSAATRAIQRLHDEVMPDVLNFQQEMRNRAKVKGKERMLDRSRDNGDHSGIKGKNKEVERGSDVQTSCTSEEERRYSKKRKPSDAETGECGTDKSSFGDSTSFKAKKKATYDSEEQVSDVRRSGKPSKRSSELNPGSTSRRSEGATKSVKLMTTQVNLNDDVVKVLTRLGIKMTTKPSECTHLLAPHLVRTEKFLCALAVAPFILSESWALESAAAKTLLAEDEYLLQDPDNERKYSFRLPDALHRAKKTGGRLFANHTFYVTPKVPVDLKLLRNVVTSGGGQLIIQTPTPRILNANSNRHIVSCEADAPLWRPLAEQDYPIYTHELLLTSTLKQEVDWENTGYRVQGSV